MNHRDPLIPRVGPHLVQEHRSSGPRPSGRGITRAARKDAPAALSPAKSVDGAATSSGTQTRDGTAPRLGCARDRVPAQERGAWSGTQRCASKRLCGPALLLAVLLAREGSWVGSWVASPRRSAGSMSARVQRQSHGRARECTLHPEIGKSQWWRCEVFTR